MKATDKGLRDPVRELSCVVLKAAADGEFLPPDFRAHIKTVLTHIDTQASTIAEMEATKERIDAVIKEQCEDEALWCKAEYISEAHMQTELRKLHAAVENTDFLGFKKQPG